MYLTDMSDTAGSARLSTVLPPHKAASATSRQVSWGHNTDSDEVHVSDVFYQQSLADMTYTNIISGNLVRCKDKTKH